MLVSGKGRKQGWGSPCEGVRKGKKGRARRFLWVKGENDAARGDRDLMLIRDGPCGVPSQDIRIGERWSKAILLVEWFTVCGGRARRGGGFQKGEGTVYLSKSPAGSIVWSSLQLWPLFTSCLTEKKGLGDGNLRPRNQTLSF